tara:strand:- start:1942 stop:3771 length:1830 start_codon:yes stop_codon:yes gene_type:complete
MANLRIFNQNNTVIIAGKPFPAGTLSAANNGTQNITITRTDNSKVIVKGVPYNKIVDKDGSAWGASAAATVTALNNYINTSDPDGIITTDSNITSLSGVTASDFQSKGGYSVFVGGADGSLQTSDSLLLSGSDLKLGGALISNASTNISLTPGSSGKVRIHDTYNLPTSDGSNGQVIGTNGSGTLSFVDNTAGATGPTGPTGAVSIVQTFAVTVANTGSGNKYYIDGSQQASLTLLRGHRYVFDQSDSSNSSHPIAISTTSNGTHNGGSAYTTGWTYSGTAGSSGANASFEVPTDAPASLYYYCVNHSGMGGSITTEVLQSGSDGATGPTGPAGADGSATINNNADNLVITGSGTAGTLEAEAKLTFDSSKLSVLGSVGTTNGVEVYGGALNSANAYISPVGSVSLLQFGNAATGLVFDIRGNKIAFDNDATNTYILADADNPENLEIHADGNIELRADDDVQVIGDINIGGSATIDNVIADTSGLSATSDIGHGAEITFLGTSSDATTVGKIYYYDGSTWQFYSSSTEAAQKALLGYSLGSTMASGFLLRGFVHADSSSLTAGAQVFGHTNASATPSAPTSGFQRVMGHAVANDIFYFNPSQEYIDLA